MKKLLILILCLFISAGSSFAKSFERKIVKNASLSQVHKVISDTLDLYKGVITVVTLDSKSHKYVVEYNATTLSAEVGLSKVAKDKYAKAQFSCNLEQKGSDVLMTVRKICYTGWFGSNIVFNHQKKLYKELEINGYQVLDLLEQKEGL